MQMIVCCESRVRVERGRVGEQSNVGNFVWSGWLMHERRFGFLLTQTSLLLLAIHSGFV